VKHLVKGADRAERPATLEAVRWVWLATVSALGTGLLAVRLGYSPLDDPGGHQLRGVLHPP